jgi:hypothetical protein
MRANSSTASLIKSALATTVLLLGASVSFAQTVNLTAGPAQAVLPDGQSVPMWGYTCGAAVTGATPSTTATCAATNAATSPGGLAAGNWSPVLITVPYNGPGTTLTINLTNSLAFTAGTGTNTVPTSIVIVGQLGGGLGNNFTTTPSPVHAPLGLSWPAAAAADTSASAITLTSPGSGYTTVPNVAITGGGGTGATATAAIVNGAVTSITLTNPGTGYTTQPTVAIDPPAGCTTACATATATANLASLQSAGNTTFTPPSQPPRVQSFATEVAATGATPVAPQVASGSALTWSNLRPGTYLIESGTHPSIQGPMGLYGVLVVTTPATAADPTTNPATSAAPAQAYPGVAYDADLPLILSEIDPVQNRAVATAVATAGFSETAVWSGQPGQCGDPASTSYNTCYPPAVNYSPLYYLINGVSFDRTNLAASTLTTLAPASGGASVAATTGNVLLRFVNAGLRMHVPSVVNASMTLVAEDGNPLPGAPRVQSEVFLAAGKTYDVAIHPALTAATLGNYVPVTYAVYDRQLSLSTNNQRDGGMQAYVQIAGGAAAGSVGTAASGSTLGATSKTFYCVAGTPLRITDPSKGVLGGSTGANGAALVAGTLLPTTAQLAFQSDGTFTYTPAAAATTCAGSFSFTVNGVAATTYTATIAECDHASQAAGCTVGGAPTANNDTYMSTVATRLHIASPGVLANDTDPSGLPLTVDTTTIASTGMTVVAQADGSFTATAPAPGTYTFTYQVKNSQGTPSAVAATVTVVFPTPSKLTVNLKDAINGAPITDYRWTIEEDRTFWVDPACQLNSTDPALRPASCPPLPVQSIGYNFHTANMPVVATGCVGTISCESGQTVLGTAAACDLSNGVCRTVTTDPTATQKVPLDPSQVYLDPNKRYYLSVMPGDGINPTLNGQGAPIQDPVTGNTRPFRTTGGAGNLGDCTSFVAGSGNCGHTMGGAQIAGNTVAAGQTIVNIKLQRTPLPTAQITVFVFEDDNPLNGENDAGGPAGTFGPAPNEAGIGNFNVVLFDQAGGLGDNTGQPTYDMFNQPLSNALAGTKDPLTGLDACPLTQRTDGLIGMIPVCPRYESDGTTLSPLVGQAVIKNLYPGLYEIQAMPAADRIARGEEWLQTNTLDGGKPHEAFVKPDEPGYFQEFGPGNFHVTIGFANPKIINDRLRNGQTGLCDPAPTGGGLTCNADLYGAVTQTHMSRTPDQRTYSSGDYTAYSFSQCYIGIGPADGPDFGFAKCDPDGHFEFHGIPPGDYKLTVFDQWNDIMLDGLVNHVAVGGTGVGSSAANPWVFPVTQWRTNLYTRTFLDVGTGAKGSPGYGDGVSNLDSSGNPIEPGLPLVPTNIRYRDGSFGFFNNTDLNGFAGWNEVFPFMNWLVVETDSTRYKQTGTHVVVDDGGPVDGTPGGGSSVIGDHLANTLEQVSLPLALRVPGAVYCATADCTGKSIAAGPASSDPPTSCTTTNGVTTCTAQLSSGRIDPPQPWGPSVGWQGLLGQSTFMEFGMTPFIPGENGGIRGHVVYASTRPFDDPALLLHLSWEPGVPRVQINLYQEGTAPDGQQTLKLVDTTTTSSWDDWAQGFRRDASGNLMTYSYTDAQGHSRTGYIPNMNCPGQDPTSPFFATLQGSTQWLDDPATHPAVPGKLPIAADAQFKCYDGWSQLNQAQPAPYDGKYTFPSVTAVDPTTGKPAGTNCDPTVCVDNPSGDGTKMLPAGKYVVEVIVPPGFELVKEEDKNILLGDIYVAPVTVQFPGGVGNIFIMPDQASVNASYNKNNPLNSTNDLGSISFPRHEGDTGTIESYWPCVGAMRIVPDYNSLFPGAQQTAPFAGATRPLCDRKEVTLEDQSAALAKFYVFTPAHIAGHFTGVMTNDFASEFDPFSPQFGEKFGPPNLPVGLRDFAGVEMGRVYADQWGVYDGLYYSSWEVNPPNPTGYAPQMAITCMNDPGPIPRTNAQGQYIDATGTVVATADLAQMITDPSYNPAYSNFCYEMPFMPGFTAYMDTPVIPTQAFADGYNLPDAEYPDATPAIATVTGDVPGPWVSAANRTLTITALGDKVVQNPSFSGPGATTAPFNQKTLTRHYGFGNAAGTVTIAGVPATCSGWTDTQITCTVPVIPATLTNGVGSTCASTSPAAPGQTPMQRSATAAQNNAYRCGELVITTAAGKQSIDAVTVTVAGKPPAVVSGENAAGNALQSTIDAAAPGDLVIVGPGTYKEHLLMWKPIRLQGAGAASVTINADAHPAGVLDPWRRQVNCLFGLALNGAPRDPVKNPSYDPTGTYTCPDSMYMRSDRIPFEAIVGWDASGNGNLAQVLQEPTLMGAYEGAGITVLGRGIRIPAGSSDFWGQGTAGAAGGFPDGSVYLTSSAADCTSDPTDATGHDYGTSNFLCNPSRIDGVSITNSSQGGGAVFVHGWNHNLEIANSRIYANHGTLTGGINLGNGETPPLYTNDGTICGATVPAPRPLCPPIPAGTLPNGPIPFAINTKMRVHNNAIYDNASIGDALFSGSPSGAGAVTVSAGADDYRLDHNWIAGNLSTGDGGGVAHSGLSYRGRIDHNWIVFNQSTNPTLPTNGGGLAIIGASGTRNLPNGTECGTTTDADCPPGLGDGTGAGLVIDANLILGNSAESGSGGGLRLQQVNGTEVSTFPMLPEQWYDVTVTNNIIANNVAGWDGAGVSLEDAFKVKIVNNTIASNDTTASAGVLFKTLAAPTASSTPPGCTPTTDPTQPQNPNCLSRDAAHNPQPAGLVTSKNTPNMVDALTGVVIRCPTGYGYSGGVLGMIDANCRLLSIPVLTNDLFWQNRAFHVEISGAGTGLQSQQNLVSMVPMLNQTSTGFCAAAGVAADGTTPMPANYWDVGVRDDVVPNDGAGGATLSLNNSILTPIGVTYGGSNNRYPSSSPVLAQYCNGSRVPPENGGHGYQSPPGASETTSLATLFVFNNITPAATVDEGNNWINLTYGPLALFNTAGQSMLATSPSGPTLGAYSIGAASDAVNHGTSTGAPALDFFGNPRQAITANPVDIGAVEFQPPNAAVPVVSPASLAFGAVLQGTSVTKDLTLSNVGAAQLTTINTLVSPTPPFSRITTGTFPNAAPNCGATLAAGASCTIRIQYAAPAQAGTSSSGTATVTASVAVTNSSVALSGSSAAPTYLASIGPSALAFGNWAGGTTSPTLNVSVHNTGNSPLSALNYTFGGGTPQPFTRVTNGTFPAGAPNCGATLAVGAACTIKVQFAAPTVTAATNFSRTLTVTGGNGLVVTPASVTLTATAVAARATVSITPDPLTITVPTGRATATGVVTLTNTAPSNGAQMTVSGVTVSGGSLFTYFFNVGGLAGPNTCTGATLAPGASCTVTVSFTNTGATRGINRNGTIRFTDNAQGSPQTGALIGYAMP